MTPEQLKARNEAIKRAWANPELRARAREKNPPQPNSKRNSREAWNAYMRAYRRKIRAQALGLSMLPSESGTDA